MSIRIKYPLPAFKPAGPIIQEGKWKDEGEWKDWLNLATGNTGATGP